MWNGRELFWYRIIIWILIWNGLIGCKNSFLNIFLVINNFIISGAGVFLIDKYAYLG